MKQNSSLKPETKPEAKPNVRLGEIDALMYALCVALIGFGVVMVFSASTVEARLLRGDPYMYLRKQGPFALGAVAVIYLVSRVDYEWLRKPWVSYGGLGAVGLMLLASISGLGHSGGGAARWLAIGPVHFQPSELAKLAMVLWLAYSLDKKKERVHQALFGLVPHFAIFGLFALLCMAQPDFGGTVVLGILTFALLFVAGASVLYLSGIGVILLGLGAIAVQYGYRWERIQAWMDMAQHRLDLAYQPFQAVMSFGSGGLFGVGLGKGRQVLYLPEAHTDFISAIVGEELGLIGVLALCGVYLAMVARGVRIAVRAETEFGSYLAFGISMFLGFQSVINLAMAMALAPTKGLTLPFVSYGGSSLLVNALAIGVLLSISRSREVKRAANLVTGPGVEASAFVAERADWGDQGA